MLQPIQSLLETFEVEFIHSAEASRCVTKSSTACFVFPQQISAKKNLLWVIFSRTGVSSGIVYTSLIGGSEEPLKVIIGKPTGGQASLLECLFHTTHFVNFPRRK